MDLTSIDPKFTCTEEIDINNFNGHYYDLLYGANLYVINDFNSIFPWDFEDLTSYFNMNVGTVDTGYSMLNVSDLCKNFKKTKYVLNNYSDFYMSLGDSMQYSSTSPGPYDDYIINYINNELSDPDNLNIDYINWETIYPENMPSNMLGYHFKMLPLSSYIPYKFTVDNEGYAVTLINLLYSTIYDTWDDTLFDEMPIERSTIDKNNILLFYLLIDIYFALSPKINDGDIIEDLTKPIILQSIPNNIYNRMIMPEECNEEQELFKYNSSMKCLSNRTNLVLNNLYVEYPDIYEYFVNVLNFIDCERHGTYGNFWWSILFPIMIPLPIDIVNGIPKLAVGIRYTQSHFNTHYSAKAYDIFFVLRIIDSTGEGIMASPTEIESIITNLWENGKIGNAWPIQILGVFKERDSNDSYPLLLILCKGSYQGPIELDWVTVSGSQYIDVGLKGNGSTDAFEIEFQQTTHQTQVRFVSDVTAAGATSTNACQMYINGSKGLSYNPGSTAKWYEISSSYRNTSTNKYKWLIDYKNKITRINNGQWSCNVQNTTTSLNIGIFAKSGSSPRFVGKLFSFKMWKNGTLSRDMVPVRVGTTAYLYDKLNHKLYSTGAGTLALGPDKVTEYDKVDYIQTLSSTYQYIATDCFPSGANISFRIKFRIISYGDTGSYSKIMSAYYADANQAFRIIRNNTSSNSLIITCGGKANSTGNVTQSITLGKDYEIFCDSLTHYMAVNDGTNITYTQLPATSTPINIVNLTIGDIARKVSFRLYELTIWDNEICIGDFQPVRIIDRDGLTCGALYDKINDKVLQNMGSGLIGVGNETATWNYSSSYQEAYNQFFTEAKYMYVDDFWNETTLSNIEQHIQDDGEFASYEDFLNDYLNYPDTNSCAPEKYKYTGTEIEWNGQSYYLWELVDELDNYIGGTQGRSDVAYIITDTVTYLTLYNKSIEHNHSNLYCPYVARLNEDMSVAYATTADSKDFIIRVEKEDYANQYFTVNILSDGIFKWDGYNCVLTNGTGYKASYNKNGTGWVNFNESHMSLNVITGDKIYFRMYCQNGTNAITVFNFAETNQYNISTCTFSVEGNIMSLLYGDEFKGKNINHNDHMHKFNELFKNNIHLISAENLVLAKGTLPNRCYESMFEGCTNLITAPKVIYASAFVETLNDGNTYSTGPCDNMFKNCTSLVTGPRTLPSITVGYGYYSMFEGCTSLEVAPELPATVLTEGCYYRMFYGCASLVTVPKLSATTTAYACCSYMFCNCTSLINIPTILSATTLYYNCYNAMFEGCISLTTAPVLPALTLASNCYEDMFYNCSSLNYVKAMFTTSLDTWYYTRDWLYNVASEGTFVMNAAADWMYDGYGQGSNGVPVGWTVQTASS